MDVGVFAVDGVADFGLGALLEILGTANTLRDEIGGPATPWRIIELGSTATVRTGAGHLVPVTTIAELTDFPQLLVIPASTVREPDGLIGVVREPRHAALLDLLGQAREHEVPLAAACTGTFFLAEAGVLDGMAATTSWWLAPAFRRHYPRVRLEESRTLCRADGVLTAGAAFAHIDLALALVRARSPALADLVARYLLIGSRPVQANLAIPAVLARADPTVAAFERWVRANLDRSLSIAAAAAALGFSERKLQRATAAALGMSPLDFVTEIRIDRAAQLLRTTELSTDAVARRVGYQNGSTLRDVVRRRRGVTIRELRDGFVPLV